MTADPNDNASSSTLATDGIEGHNRPSPAPPTAAGHSRAMTAHLKEATCTIKEVVLGDTWIRPEYSSFYPADLVDRELERLYVCPSCFKYTTDVAPFRGHVDFCEYQDIRGVFEKVVYQKDDICVLELDGDDFKTYAQNLSLFAKLFLDTKSVFYDVNNFLYYLLVHVSQTSRRPQAQVVGFFSKEKLSWDNNNLACILVFPPWQRRGYGQMLMSISYLLSKRERRLGGPEKPLSELGKRAYIQFWAGSLARHVLTLPARRTTTIKSISDDTYITPEDVLMTLREMQVLEHKNRGTTSTVISKAKVKAYVLAHRLTLNESFDVDVFNNLNPMDESELEYSDGSNEEVGEDDDSE